MFPGQEFTFDVDVSNLPGGLNGALYFVSMDADGGMSKYPTNKAGAKYGTGYCDSQCPRDLKFINGQVCCSSSEAIIRASSLLKYKSRQTLKAGVDLPAMQMLVLVIWDPAAQRWM